jgi:predicted RNA-binding protein YlxR (DUF448 family)
MQGRRRTPERSCASCRGKQAKRELIRIVRSPDGHVRVDEHGRAAGRGTYLHRDEECWRRALSGGTLAGALRIDVSQGDLDALAAYAATLALAGERAVTDAGGGEA